MNYQKKYYDGIQSIGMIGNYLPRQCGIATFTTDLTEAILLQSPDLKCWVVAMNDSPAGYPYPKQVRFEINQNKLQDYRVAAEFLIMKQMDVVCVQHEYGIFGGPAGSHLLRLLGDLPMPIVTTLHTVLKDPLPEYREVLLRLAELSDRLIVMSQKAIGFLKDIYKIPEDKISFVHHGIPDTPFVDPNYYKDQFGVEAKKVLLTFGLLSPAKGIENVLMAMPAILEKHPDVVYMILGATHPHVLKTHGEEYRISLQQLALKLGIAKQVIFQNRFVELEELCEYLGTADIYITPYLSEAQITSGTLVYAMGTGKAVISTPYWYAQEMLAEGRGIVVPFRDPDAIAREVIGILSDERKLNSMRKKAYTFCREAVWKEVGRKYLEIFKEVKMERALHPHPKGQLSKIRVPEKNSRFEFPDLKFDHLLMLTDDTGILQHATHTVPNRTHGYCTDDNARALIVAAKARCYQGANDRKLRALANCYLSFLQFAFNPKTGRFRNFMTYSRQWLEEVGSEDSHGRAIWGLGKAVLHLDHSGHMALATGLFGKAMRALGSFSSPRALAFSLIGIGAYLKKFTGDSEVRHLRESLAQRLLEQFQKNATDDWPWLENSLNYANAKLPHALLLSGQALEKQEMMDFGLKSLQWLWEIQSEEGHFSPVGNHGWYERGGAKAHFDQQPIEAHAMIEACVDAFRITRNRDWFDRAILCFHWFLGYNDLGLSLYDAGSGGCRDGLMADGVNENEGAESTLAWLLSHMAVQRLYSNEVLNLPLHENSIEK